MPTVTLPAKLFASAALVLALIASLALVLGWVDRAGIDVYMHFTYFVVTIPHVFLLWAIIFGLFAALYFAFFRWLRLPLNPKLSRLHFILIVLSLVLLMGQLLVLQHTIGSYPNESWYAMINFALPAYAFALGCLLFIVNLLWGLLRKQRHA